MIAIKLQPCLLFKMLMINLDSYVLLNFLSTFFVLILPQVSYYGFVMRLKVLAPLPIGFAVFMVHLATIPVTGTGINPARSFGAAVMYNQKKAWDDQVSICRLNLITCKFYTIIKFIICHVK